MTPKIIFIYLALATSVLLVFWQVRTFNFVDFDDGAYVYENHYVTNGLTQDGFIWAFTAGHASNWHPMTWLSLMLDCQLFGLNPGRMHLVNVFFHLANTVLLFAVLKKMTGALWPSALVAAAFALHPMHVESVAWITERKDVLSTFFLLLTIAAYAGYVKRPSVFRYAAALLLFALGLMAKPMLVTLPFVLLLLDYWPHNRFEGVWPQKNSGQSASAKDKRSILYRLILEKVPFVALSVISSVITFLIQRRGGAMTDTDIISLEARLANALLSYVRYIGKLFWPKDLAVLYPLDPTGGIPLSQLTLCVPLLLGVTILVLCWGRRRKYLPVGWFWFVGTLVPVIGLVQVGSQAYADRYTYIPHIGLFMMIAWGLPELLSTWPYHRAVLGVMAVGVLTASGLWAHRQTGYWKDSIALFSRAIEATPNNYSMHINLGVAYNALGRHEEAMKVNQRVIRVSPDYAEAYNNLGLSYGGLGRHQEAIEAYQQAIRIQSDYAEVYNNLGITYRTLGRRPEAMEAYRQAIRIKPDYAVAHYNLGLMYYSLGCYREAIEAYKQAIKLKPEDAKFHNNLGVAYYSLGRYQEAIEADKQAIRINPNDAVSYNNLGAACSNLGRYKEAAQAFRQTIRIRPERADAHLSLGLACLAIGDKDSATKEYEILKSLNAEMADKLLNRIKQEIPTQP